MRKELLITVFLFVCSSFICICQENEEKTYRIQGYLIIQKSTEPTSEKNIHNLLIDNPEIYFFRPLEFASSNTLENLLSLNAEESKLFLPMGLSETTNSIYQTNLNFEGYLNIKPLNNILEEKSFFVRKEKSIIKKNNDNLKNTVYEIVFIDGIWTKVFVPYKYKDLIPIGNYTTALLDPNKRDGYEYYFLKEIKVISYDLNFNDKLIIQLK